MASLLRSSYPNGIAMIWTQNFVGAHRAEHPQEVGAMLTKPPGNAGEARRGFLVLGLLLSGVSPIIGSSSWKPRTTRSLLVTVKSGLGGGARCSQGFRTVISSLLRGGLLGGWVGGQREGACRPTNLSHGPVFQDLSHRLLPH